MTWRDDGEECELLAVSDEWDRACRTAAAYERWEGQFSGPPLPAGATGRGIVVLPVAATPRPGSVAVYDRATGRMLYESN